MKKTLIALLVIFGVVVMWSFVLTRKKELSLLNPLSWVGQTPKTEEKGVEVVGFLPTWMIGKTRLYGDELTQLIFSGVEVKPDGSLLWDVQSKKLDNDEYLKLKNNVKKNGGRNLLSIKLFTDKEMEKLLADTEAKKRMYSDVRDVVVAGKFDGVNVDFEYMSSPTRVLDADFGLMLDEMKAAGWGEINIDVFANTIIKGDSERIKRMADRVDGIIVMAYDFHQQGSDYAGAVAPMGAVLGQRSIGEIIQKIADFNLPKEKFIMAYPLYGYEWETDTGELGSTTRSVGYGSTVQYRFGVGITNVNWDEVSQTPWASWEEKAQRSRVVTKKVGKKYKKVTEYFMVDQWHSAYFENEKSLGIKVEATKQAGLAGIGFWALGYEGADSNLVYNLKNLISNE